MTNSINVANSRLFHEQHQGAVHADGAPSSISQGTNRLGSTTAKTVSSKAISRTNVSNSDSQTKLSEQDIYAAQVYSKLSKQSPQAAKRFSELLPTAITQAKKSGSDNVMLNASNKVLDELVKEGLISNTTSSDIKTQAFSDSQIDSDSKTLQASSSGMSLEEILQYLLKNTDASLEEIDALKSALGKVTQAKKVSQAASASGAKSMSSATTAGSVGNKGLSLVDGAPSNTFLWKPVSDSTGKLAILLPASMTGKAASISVLSPDGKSTLATGRFSGVGNGQRQHYRFDQPGSNFPDGAIVRITMQDGTTKDIKITETSARTEMK